MSDEEPLIKGWRIDPIFMKDRSLRRCGLDDCRGWCCGLGVWVDLQHHRRILEHAELIKPYLPPERRDESRWFDGVIKEDIDFPCGKCTGTEVARIMHHFGAIVTFLYFGLHLVAIATSFWATAGSSPSSRPAIRPGESRSASGMKMSSPIAAGRASATRATRRASQLRGHGHCPSRRRLSSSAAMSSTYATSVRVVWS